MEKVLVFESSRHLCLRDFEGSICLNQSFIDDFTSQITYIGPDSIFLDKDVAEVTPAYKQIIPYCVIRRDGKIFSYQRTSKAGETRLHGKCSIGVGGHINTDDVAGASLRAFDGDFHAPYAAALRRELKEEIGLVLPDGLSAKAPIKALLYDDSDLVGQVHYGLVHVIDVGADVDLRLREAKMDNARWMTPDELKQESTSYENWSRIIIGSEMLTKL